MEIKYIVDIDKIQVKEFLKIKGCSRNLMKKARIEDCIFVNGVLQKNYFELKIDDELIIRLSEKINDAIFTNPKPLPILYEDPYLLIITKPSDVSIQPSRKHAFDNVVSMVKHHFVSNNIDSNVHIINRLDFHTTGIVIVAKTGNVQFEMSKTSIEKKYLCWVHGVLTESGTIDAPIRRKEPILILRCVALDGQRAITHYKVLKSDKNSLLEVHLETGRTHQIRVHMAHIGHPIVGDALYGYDLPPLMLHCYGMAFIHPITKESICIINYPEWYKEE